MPLWAAVVIALVMGAALGFGWGILWPRKDEREQYDRGFFDGYRRGKRWCRDKATTEEVVH